MKHCDFCGKELKVHEVCSCNQGAEYKKHSHKKLKIAVIIGVLLLMSIVVISIILTLRDNDNNNNNNHNPNDTNNNTTQVNPFDYCSVSFSGCNGYGKLIIKYDEPALIESIIGECFGTESDEYISAWLKDYVTYEEGIDYTYSSANNLSNGDKIVVTFEVADSIKDKVKGGTKTFFVSGLSEVTTVDLFSELDITFTGISGNVTATFKYLSDDSISRQCDFYISSQFNLSSGDVITVTLSDSSQQMLLKSFNMIPKETSKVYTVPDMPKYVTDSSELPQDILQQISAKYFSDTKDSITNDSIFTYKNFQTFGIFFMTKKETASFLIKENNRLEFVVSYDEYVHGEFYSTTYISLAFTNVVINPDGTLQITYEDGESHVFNQATLEADFNVVKIDSSN